ncbi:MAG: hypothetical protein Ct9H90mP5_01970 [Acidimicrobiaceae bacterium]|nr:MAG: hypothetical protein Ct9H90mP5_01970 [Acidimicrobiaceae bacterium]
MLSSKGCLYHWVDHPGYLRKISKYLKLKPPTFPKELIKKIAVTVEQIREMNL